MPHDLLFRANLAAGKQLNHRGIEGGQVFRTATAYPVAVAYHLPVNPGGASVTQVILNATPACHRAAFDNARLINVDASDEFLANLTTLNSSNIGNIASPTQELLQQSLQIFAQTNRETSSPIEVTFPSPATAVRIEGLTRKFGKLTAVDHVDMTTRQEEIYGFLGSNGAGKTTIMKMLVGLLQPDEGHAWITGYDVWAEPLAVKTVLGYVANRSVLYERLTGREFLTFLGQIRKLPLKETGQQVESLLTLLELTEHADRLCGTYSFGMKRKLSLALLLLAVYNGLWATMKRWCYFPCPSLLPHVFVPCTAHFSLITSGTGCYSKLG